MDRCTSRTASAVQASGIPARLFNLFPHRCCTLDPAWLELSREAEEAKDLVTNYARLPTYLERVYKKEPLSVHYPPSTLGEAIRKLSFCRR